MKTGVNLMTVVGLVLSLIAGIAVYEVLGHHAPTSQVVVATTTIPQFASISASDVVLVNETSSDVPPNAIGGMGQAVGHFATTTIFPGQILVGGAVAVTAAGGSSGLLAALGPNVRAYSVSASVADAIAGNIAVGDQVDIIVTTGGASGNGNALGGSGPSASIVVQHVTVLAVATSSGSAIASGASNTVAPSSTSSSSSSQQEAAIYTLALTPTQVETVALAQASGALSLALDPPSASLYGGGPATGTSLPGSAAIGPPVQLPAVAAATTNNQKG